MKLGKYHLTRAEAQHLENGGRIFSIEKDEENRFFMVSIKKEKTTRLFADTNGFPSAKEALSMAEAFIPLTEDKPLLHIPDNSQWTSNGD